MTTQTRIAAVLAAALIAAPLALPSAAFAQSADASKGHEYTATMGNMDYSATPSGLKVGDTIVWTNHDTVIHSVTARDHSFDLRLNPGQSAKLTLTQAGKISFYCLFHPTMRGTLNVAPNWGATTASVPAAELAVHMGQAAARLPPFLNFRAKARN